MLAPKRVTYAKPHRVSYLGNKRSPKLSGNYGIVAATGGEISAAQMEAARRVISRAIKGAFSSPLFPHLARTRKPKEVRMGKGKGAFDSWYLPVKAGHLLFEFQQIEPYLARKLTHVVASKCPFKVRLIEKAHESTYRR